MRYRHEWSGYLVEEVLHQFRDAYVVVVSMDEKHLLEVFKLWDGVVAVPHRLAALLTHDAWRVRAGFVVKIAK